MNINRPTTHGHQRNVAWVKGFELELAIVGLKEIHFGAPKPVHKP